jgi:putative hemolysin
MKEILVSHDDLRGLHPIFRGRHGDRFIELGMKIAAMNVPNEIYDRSKHLTGPAFCRDVLDKLEIKRILRNSEVLHSFGNQPFITVSNHPYGHIDGIAAIEALGSRLPDYRMMVNFFLGLIDTMEENFIKVNPMKDSEKKSVTYSGIRESIAHLRQGHPLGFFPAGAVSNLYLKRGRLVIEDQDWQPATLKIIRKMKVPVIPMHISGHNSPLFYLSRILGWRIRNLRLCHELYNKKGHEMVLTFGDPILPEEFSRFYDDTAALGRFLKARTYALGRI